MATALSFPPQAFSWDCGKGNTLRLAPSNRVEMPSRRFHVPSLSIPLPVRGCSLQFQVAIGKYHPISENGCCRRTGSTC